MNTNDGHRLRIYVTIIDMIGKITNYYSVMRWQTLIFIKLKWHKCKISTKVRTQYCLIIVPWSWCTLIFAELRVGLDQVTEIKVDWGLLLDVFAWGNHVSYLINSSKNKVNMHPWWFQFIDNTSSLHSIHGTMIFKMFTFLADFVSNYASH